MPFDMESGFDGATKDQHLVNELYTVSNQAAGMKRHEPATSGRQHSQTPTREKGHSWETEHLANSQDSRAPGLGQGARSTERRSSVETEGRGRRPVGTVKMAGHLTVVSCGSSVSDGDPPSLSLQRDRARKDHAYVSLETMGSAEIA
ncbi:hypothetical protein BDP55DRAFT_663680 [Colletotrichum godetiae]|uniref:Uncharacterized protein n=1 Tax=Colletotrichum godetiae TaxID=1209918 RepID=A0AAJ0AKW9_9PEZI|nr:uncharacterized protein BDP55DRAFT_663680 [Colletotrichum godetiae]KAK1675776.1 hypothetical protein BDP55DRAFT_663680 [Colletotrichum godetiae]